MNNNEAKRVILEADSCFCKHGAYKDCHSGCKYREALDAAIKALEQEPKPGHWIERRNRATGHIESVCSECGAEEGYPYNDYCGNCGARMVEPQESEDDGA